jgi:hypothetical protein
MGTIPSKPRELCNRNTGLGEPAVGTSLGTLSGNICGTYCVDWVRERMWVPLWGTVSGMSLET